jgi:hypothetical protein
MYPPADHVHAGGLMSLRVNNRDLFRRAATYVDKILLARADTVIP